MAEAWKKEEMRVGRLFRMRRRPLSGNSTAGLGPGDVMKRDGSQPDLVIEVKSWSRMPHVKHIEKVRAEAQGKPWVLAIHLKGSHRRFAIVETDFLADLWNAQQDAETRPKLGPPDGSPLE